MRSLCSQSAIACECHHRNSSNRRAKKKKKTRLTFYLKGKPVYSTSHSFVGPFSFSVDVAVLDKLLSVNILFLFARPSALTVQPTLIVMFMSNLEIVKVLTVVFSR